MYPVDPVLVKELSSFCYFFRKRCFERNHCCRTN